MKLNIVLGKPTVGVITPSVNQEKSQKAIDSVQFQSYPADKIKHYVVTDGKEFYQERKLNKPLNNVLFYTLQENTGKEHYGHRIYAAFSHLVNCDIVLFLDEDNQYDTTHIESMVETILRKNLDWCHSLRSIWDENGQYVCDDNCENLGVYPAYNGENVNLVDTSSYGFRTEFLYKVSPLWHNKYAADRMFFNALVKDMGHKNFECTKQYTLKYFLDGNPNSVKKDFFLQGNKIMEEKYNGNYPWLQ